MHLHTQRERDTHTHTHTHTHTQHAVDGRCDQLAWMLTQESAESESIVPASWLVSGKRSAKEKKV